MNENNIEGSAKTGFGKLEAVAGDAVGDSRMQAKGSARQAEGKTLDAVGSIQETVGQVAGQAKDAVSKITGQAKDAYGKAGQQAKAVGDKVEPYVKERPYAALAIAGAAGFIFARVFSRGGPKVIYVKPRD